MPSTTISSDPAPSTLEWIVACIIPYEELKETGKRCSGYYALIKGSRDVIRNAKPIKSRLEKTLKLFESEQFAFHQTYEIKKDIRQKIAELKRRIVYATTNLRSSKHGMLSAIFYAALETTAFIAISYFKSAGGFSIYIVAKVTQLFLVLISRKSTIFITGKSITKKRHLLIKNSHLLHIFINMTGKSITCGFKISSIAKIAVKCLKNIALFINKKALKNEKLLSYKNCKLQGLIIFQTTLLSNIKGIVKPFIKKNAIKVELLNKFVMKLFSKFLKKRYSCFEKNLIGASTKKGEKGTYVVGQDLSSPQAFFDEEDLKNKEQNRKIQEKRKIKGRYILKCVLPVPKRVRIGQIQSHRFRTRVESQ